MIDYKVNKTVDQETINKVLDFFNDQCITPEYYEVPSTADKHHKTSHVYTYLDQETVLTRYSHKDSGELLHECLYFNIKPHYLFNSNAHNANYFSPKDCIKTLKDFFGPFDIDYELLEPIKIEYGLNFYQPYEPEKVISLSPYQGKNRPRFDLGDNKTGYQYHKKTPGRIKHYNTFKYYCKGLHNDYHLYEYCHRNTLRAEIKCYQKERIKKDGINSLADLLNVESYIPLVMNLRNEFRRLLILDRITPIEEFNLSKTAKNRFEKYLHSETWDDFCNDSYRNKYANNYKSYLRLLDRFDGNVKNNLTGHFENQLQKLEKCAKWTYVNSPICTPTESTNQGIQDSDNGICSESIKLLHWDHPIRKKTRNDKDNPRNNLASGIKARQERCQASGQQSLFPLGEQISKTKLKLLMPWIGTKYDLFPSLGIDNPDEFLSE